MEHGLSRKALIFFLLLSLAWHAFQTVFYPHISGELGYQVRAAERFYQGEGWLSLFGDIELTRPPLLTVVIWLNLFLGISAETTVKLVFIVTGTLGLWLLYTFVCALFGKRTALYAALVWSVLPLANSVLLTTPTHGLMHVFVLLLMHTALRMIRGDTRPLSFVALGIWGGLAYLSRAEGLLYFFALLGVAWLLSPERWWRRWPNVLLAIAVFLAVASPYLVFLRYHTGHWAASVETEAVRYVPQTWPLMSYAYEPDASVIWGDAPHTFLNAFLHNPKGFIKRVSITGRDFFYIAGGLKVIPLHLWLWIGLGLLSASAWARPRIHFLLLAGMLPTLPYLLIHLEDRYLLQFGMLLVPWLARGMAEFEGTLKSFFGARRWVPVVFSAALLVVPFGFTGVHLLKHKSESHAGCREAGLWLREHAAPDSLLITNSDILCIYSGLTLFHPSQETVLQIRQGRFPEEVESRRASELHLAIEERPDEDAAFESILTGSWRESHSVRLGPCSVRTFRFAPKE